VERKNKRNKEQKITRKNTKSSFRTVGIPAEIGTKYLPYTSLVCCRYTNAASGYISITSVFKCAASFLTRLVTDVLFWFTIADLKKSCLRAGLQSLTRARPTTICCYVPRNLIFLCQLVNTATSSPADDVHNYVIPPKLLLTNRVYFQQTSGVHAPVGKRKGSSLSGRSPAPIADIFNVATMARKHSLLNLREINRNNKHTALASV
jgi:hypothetical protein